jgi:flavin reductase (DIM6/NTAB) family NADH-FMN oxidoreductase RutF
MVIALKQTEPEEIRGNAFKLIGKDWMLITAGTRDSFNTMTASWGGMGVLWDKKVCFSVVRPTRYTYKFLEKNNTYTLSFFSSRFRKALMVCGTKSGKDTDKIRESGLTPVFDGDAVFFRQARLVFECRKLYFQDIIPANFGDPNLERFYPEKDYHRMYVGEIIRCLAR